MSLIKWLFGGDDDDDTTIYDQPCITPEQASDLSDDQLQEAINLTELDIDVGMCNVADDLEAYLSGTQDVTRFDTNFITSQVMENGEVLGSEGQRLGDRVVDLSTLEKEQKKRGFWPFF